MTGRIWKRHSREGGNPVVSSPIYWNIDYFPAQPFNHQTMSKVNENRHAHWTESILKVYGVSRKSRPSTRMKNFFRTTSEPWTSERLSIRTWYEKEKYAGENYHADKHIESKVIALGYIIEITSEDRCWNGTYHTQWHRYPWNGRIVSSSEQVCPEGNSQGYDTPVPNAIHDNKKI